MLRLALTAIILLLVLSSCNLSHQLEDGYQLGDAARAAGDTARDYCKPIYIPIRFAGRWMLRLIGYPAPDFCKVGQSIIR